jgi:hypothetical protein
MSLFKPCSLTNQEFLGLMCQKSEISVAYPFYDTTFFVQRAKETVINRGVPSWRESRRMKARHKILDFEFTEVLDIKTRELIRVACAVAVNCPD